nr:MAG TPA: hypothetical protein [Caudoviricetes sp.]
MRIFVSGRFGCSEKVNRTLQNVSKMLNIAL